MKTQGNVVWMQSYRDSDEDLVAMSHSGNEHALSELISRFLSLTRLVARHYFIRGGDQQDVTQEGLIGLFKAIRDFDSETGTSFAAFAHLCITRQILTAVKAATRPNHEVLSSSMSLDEPLPTRPHGREWEDFLTDPAAFDPLDLVVAAEEIDAIRACLTQDLTQLESDALALYLEGNSYDQIAGTLGRQTKALDNALQRVRSKLSRRLHEYDSSFGSRHGDIWGSGERLASPWQSPSAVAVQL